MTKYGHCACCNRSFRTASQRALSDLRRAVIEDLRLSVADNNSTPDASQNRRDRHLEHAREFRQHGEINH